MLSMCITLYYFRFPGVDLRIPTDCVIQVYIIYNLNTSYFYNEENININIVDISHIFSTNF